MPLCHASLLVAQHQSGNHLVAICVGKRFQVYSGKGNSSFARFGLHVNWWNGFLSPCFNISEFNLAPPLEDSHSDLWFQEFLAIGRLFKNNVWHLGHWHPETPVVGKWGLDGYPGATVSIKLMAVMSFVAWRSPVYCRLFDKVPLSCLFQHFKFVSENEYETLVLFFEMYATWNGCRILQIDVSAIDFFCIVSTSFCTDMPHCTYT